MFNFNTYAYLVQFLMRFSRKYLHFVLWKDELGSWGLKMEGSLRLFSLPDSPSCPLPFCLSCNLTPQGLSFNYIRRVLLLGTTLLSLPFIKSIATINPPFVFQANFT